MNSAVPRIEFPFDHFTVQPSERRQITSGVPVAVGPRAFDVLLLLVENSDILVAKTQLLQEVWRGLVVEETDLHVQVSALANFLEPFSQVTTGPKN